ncbi:MAG: AAA family ATPase [Candidatus Omnitrophica bacterium]|nr:AAA family ATPase [Candidatus Omnitrophota bacterium]
MHFKSLELVGFKSFAEKTLIKFEPGVTAIVGPNGCGKSNVADAIRWVLGEQSARSLRGGLMEDVIFNGSAARDPVNFAEVSLTLSNESKILPIDYEEVTIARRLYRSGESEYLLNKNTVRLRDIQDLLMGTGIGTESYAIIEQGKMDLILSSKPEDRRIIFEEAAGITKYKSRKKEALRKLEQTEANLLRVNDIIAEVKRQIGSVERQAKKAEQYKAEFEKLKKMELAVASREFILFERRRKEKETELEVLEAREKECLRDSEDFEKKTREGREELRRAAETLTACQSEEVSASAAIRRHQDRILLNRERVGELCERTDNLSRQIQISKRRVEEFKTEHARLESEWEALGFEEREGRSALDALERDFASFEERARGADAELETAEKALSAIAARRAPVQGEMARAEARSEMAAEALAKECSLHDALHPKLVQFKNALLGFARVSEEFLGRLESEIRNFAEEILRARAEWTGEAPSTELSVPRAPVGELKNTLAALAEEEARLVQAIAALRGGMKEHSAEKEKRIVRLAEARIAQGHASAKREKIEKDRNWILESVLNEENELRSHENQIRESVSKKETLEAESRSLEEEVARLGQTRDGLLARREEAAKVHREAASRLEEDEAARQEKNEFLKVSREKVHAFQMENAQIRFETDRLKERIFNAYQVDLAAAESLEGEWNAEEAKAQIQAQREKLQKMGPVNLVAIDEFDELRARVEFLTQQERDLVQAKEDIHKAILKINRTTKELFVDTFAKVQKNFTEIYRLLFGGGTAELLLLDEDQVLESGIEIVARPPGKKLQSISLLSGGERSLTATALLFALFKVKPSPFCVLDEIDAPLDEANVDRFCGVLKEFIARSQFILITHNKRTMSLADALYGITMAENGVSRIVSVRFSEKSVENGAASGNKKEVLV